MQYLVVKAVISAILILAVSEFAKRSPALGALIAAAATAASPGKRHRQCASP